MDELIWHSILHSSLIYSHHQGGWNFYYGKSTFGKFAEGTNYVDELFNWHENQTESRVPALLLGITVVEDPMIYSVYQPGTIYLMPDVEAYPIDMVPRGVIQEVPLCTLGLAGHMIYMRLGRWFTIPPYSEVVIWT